MQVYLIGCLHLGDEWVAKHRGFIDSSHHDEFLINTWNSVVPYKRSIVWILGDITMETSKFYPLLNRLNGEKRVVLGNHDRYQDVPELFKYVKYVAGVVDYKGYILSHVPIHPNEISFCQGCIHCHIHENKLEECIVSDRYGDTNIQSLTLAKYFNVDAHLLNYKPITLDEIAEKIKQQKEALGCL